MASTNDLKNGMCLDLPEGLMQVVEFQHVKPGKGGAFVRTTLKNVRTGQVVDKTFRRPRRSSRPRSTGASGSTSTATASDYVFMDQETFEQMNVVARDAG